MTIPAWSYSRLTTFESCKLRAKLAYIDRIPEPPRPLPPGKTEHANDRGTRVHEGAELYIKADVEMLPELKYFQPELIRMKELYREGKVSLETEWAFDKDWNPVAWNSATTWARIKPDAIVMLDKTRAVVIDYKTGKRYGNEFKHSEQCQLYMIALLLRYPSIEEVTVELWYIDQDEMHQMKYTRAQGMRFFNNFNNRGLAMTDAHEFPSNPNIFSCRWCPFGPKGTGHCKDGVG